MPKMSYIADDNNRLFRTVAEYHAIHEHEEKQERLLYITLCGINSILRHEQTRMGGFVDHADGIVNSAAINHAVESAMMFSEDLYETYNTPHRHLYDAKIKRLSLNILHDILPILEVPGEGWFSDTKQITADLDKKYFEFVRCVYRAGKESHIFGSNVETWLRQHTPRFDNNSRRNSPRVRRNRGKGAGKHCGKRNGKSAGKGNGKSASKGRGKSASMSDTMDDTDESFTNGSSTIEDVDMM